MRRAVLPLLAALALAACNTAGDRTCTCDLPGGDGVAPCDPGGLPDAVADAPDALDAAVDLPQPDAGDAAPTDAATEPGAPDVDWDAWTETWTDTGETWEPPDGFEFWSSDAYESWTDAPYEAWTDASYEAWYDVDPDAPHPDTDHLRELLQVATIGLLYTSESDYPFVLVVIPGGARDPVTVDNVKDLVAPVYVPRPDSMPLADRIVEERSLEDVLANYLTPEDWWTDYEKERYPRFQALYDILKNDLHDTKVFRIGPYDEWNGMSPDIDVFFLGGTDEGDLVGLWTVSIET